MGHYAMDMENGRILRVMMELGITKEELLQKTFEDFGGPGVPYEIQELRYEHHLKLIKETTLEIRSLLKARHITILPQNSKTSVVLPSAISNKNINELQKFSYKQRALIMESLSVFEDPKQELRKKNNSEANLHTYGLKEKFKVFQKKQAQKIKEIQKEQMRFQMQLGSKISSSMKIHTEKEKMIEEQKKMQAREKEENYQRKFEEIQERKIMAEEAMESEIIEKLEKIQEKIQKSEELHREALREKIGKTMKLRKISETVARNQEEMMKSNNFEVLQKLVDKQELVKSARGRIEERISKLSESKKEAFEKRRSQALLKIKQTEKDFFLKAKQTEVKILQAERAIFERKSSFNRRLALQQEEKRLKNSDALIKVQRAKRRFVRFYLELQNGKSFGQTTGQISAH